MSTSETFAHPEFLIETEALERLLGDPGLRVLDCTTHLRFGFGKGLAIFGGDDA